MGRTVIVTGAAGSLGHAVVRTLEDAGDRVAALDRVPVAEAAASLALGGVDLTDPAAVDRAVMTAGDRLGRIDGLVNVAGGFRWEPVAGGALATWDLLYAMNLKTALVASRAVLPLMGEGGSIVNMSAIASNRAGMGTGAYAASKAGVSRLTEALAEELKDKGIRVNALLPSIIDTPANRADMPGAEFDRWVTPEQVARVIQFLLSPAASAVTGALIPVTGRL